MGGVLNVCGVVNVCLIMKENACACMHVYMCACIVMVVQESAGFA